MGFRAQTSVGTPAQLPGFRRQRHDAGRGLCVRWPSECCLGALAPTSGVWMKHVPWVHGFPCYKGDKKAMVKSWFRQGKKVSWHVRDSMGFLWTNLGRPRVHKSSREVLRQTPPRSHSLWSSQMLCKPFDMSIPGTWTRKIRINKK